MKKFAIQVGALVILIIVATYVVFKTSIGVGGNGAGSSSGSAGVITAVKINDTLIKVEVADTPAKRGQGLGGRQSLASDSGMLFVFDHSDKYQFWMKGMEFSLDFIWIDGGKVVDLLPNVAAPAPNQPDSALTIYGPNLPVDKVLEINGGFAASHNIHTGDSVEFVSGSS